MDSANPQKVKTREKLFSIGKSEFTGKSRTKALVAGIISTVIVTLPIPFHFLYLGMFKSFGLRLILVIPTMILFGNFGGNYSVITAWQILVLVNVLWNLADVIQIACYDKSHFTESAGTTDEQVAASMKKCRIRIPIVVGALAILLGGQRVMYEVRHGEADRAELIEYRENQARYNELYGVFNERVRSGFNRPLDVEYNGAGQLFVYEVRWEYEEELWRNFPPPMAAEDVGGLVLIDERKTVYGTWHVNGGRGRTIYNNHYNVSIVNPYTGEVIAEKEFSGSPTENHDGTPCMTSIIAWIHETWSAYTPEPMIQCDECNRRVFQNAERCFCGARVNDEYGRSSHE
jgi:hypothetical protein